MNFTHFSRFTPLFLALFITLNACDTKEEQKSSSDITAQDLKTHITFLASDELEGRETGKPGEAIAAAYIADLFKDYGLEPAGDDNTYLQEFVVNTSMLKNPHVNEDFEGEKRLAYNVVGTLYGTEAAEDFIIIGAHFDHLGWGDGGFGSLYAGDSLKIHYGADDNASGTAGLLELAEYFSENRPKKDILFIAFTAEEMGLLGSDYYTKNPTVDLTSAIAMINMDMIGRMKDNKLMIFGIGTADNWEDIIYTANTDSLSLSLVEDGTGASDHTSFYYQNIPVLHYFTDTHEDYHKPSDTADLINYDGEVLVLNHLTRVVTQLDEMEKSQMEFREAPGQQRQAARMEGPSLGVIPDYAGMSSDKGMEISGTTKGGAAEKAGLLGGDIIIGIGSADIADIYEYMEVLGTLKKGQKTTVTIIRNGEKLTLNLEL